MGQVIAGVPADRVTSLVPPVTEPPREGSR